jgi:hypothetical protein
MNDDADPDPDDDLLVLLGTRVGTIMEDCSVLALGLPALDIAERSAVLTELERASEAIAALVSVMRCLMAAESER